ncbi:hypothetical protein EUGRSUZ_K02559 [Eucalyptus grandis]|uniref:Uncharacterized protein n=2 Tax=Eucalyptus grandis TaxID=71139 RepID=A0A059A5G7_EUCGR|nr:hypothetical protein EUGRSUZ_K02559 [Eucalyptus grandis]
MKSWEAGHDLDELGRYGLCLLSILWGRKQVHWSENRDNDSGEVGKLIWAASESSAGRCSTHFSKAIVLRLDPLLGFHPLLLLTLGFLLFLLRNVNRVQKARSFSFSRRRAGIHSLSQGFNQGRITFYHYKGQKQHHLLSPKGKKQKHAQMNSSRSKQ